MTIEYYLESVERDPAKWVAVPGEWPWQEFEAGDEWAAATARAVWDDSALTPADGEVAQLAGVLEFCAERCPGAHPGFEVFLHLPGPREAPLPVYVGDYEFEGDPDAEVRYATSADEPGALRPPVVEDFVTPELGAGKRVLRHSRDENDPEGAVLAGLRYGWPTAQPGLIACLFTVHPHSDRVLTALADIDEFARGLRYVADDDQE